MKWYGWTRTEQLRRPAEAADEHLNIIVGQGRQPLSSISYVNFVRCCVADIISTNLLIRDDKIRNSMQRKPCGCIHTNNYCTKYTFISVVIIMLWQLFAVIFLSFFQIIHINFCPIMIDSLFYFSFLSSFMSCAQLCHYTLSKNGVPFHEERSNTLHWCWFIRVVLQDLACVYVILEVKFMKREQKKLRLFLFDYNVILIHPLKKQV